MTWLSDNIGTACVVLILLAVVIRITVKLIKDKKTGKISCGCGCAGCGMAGKCHTGENSEKA